MDMKNTDDLNKAYEDWLKYSCRSFVLVSRSLHAIDMETTMDERLGLRTYVPDRVMFLGLREHLEKAISVQPVVYRVNLAVGWFFVSWLEKVSGGWLPEITARRLTVREFASLYAAMASLQGYQNKPYVFRDEHGAIYFQ